MTTISPISPPADAIPDSSDELDEELEALLDTPPSPQPETSPKLPPPAPNTSPPPNSATTEEAPKSILDALVANKHRLTGRAAQLAAELDAVKDPNPINGFSRVPRLPIAEAMMQRRASKRSQSCAEAAREEAKRAKRARNAFAVIGRDRSKGREKEGNMTYIDNLFTNMALKEAIFPQAALQALFEHFVRVDIAEITKVDDDMRAGKLGEFVVFGCLVKKHAKRETKAGNKYAVWSMCNMPRGTLPGKDTVVKPTVVTVLLFDEAFQAFHTQVEGSVFALRKPSLLPPRGSESSAREDRGSAEWSGHCLRISKESCMVRLGVCKDLRLCEAGGPNLSICGRWYDSNRMSQCAFHTNKRRIMLLSSTRMALNNAERPRPLNNILRVNENAVDISSHGGARDKARDADDDAEKREHLRRAIDRIKANQLIQGKKNDGYETLASAQRRMERKKTTTRAETPDVSRNEKRISVTKQKQRRQLVEQKSRQAKYEQAVNVLLHYGFRLEADGSLKAPRELVLQEKGIVLKTSNGRRRARANRMNGSDRGADAGMPNENGQEISATNERRIGSIMRPKDNDTTKGNDTNKGSDAQQTALDQNDTSPEQTNDTGSTAPPSHIASPPGNQPQQTSKATQPAVTNNLPCEEPTKSDLLELSEESDSEGTL